VELPERAILGAIYCVELPELPLAVNNHEPDAVNNDEQDDVDNTMGDNTMRKESQ
jgi:hypothetical protein